MTDPDDSAYPIFNQIGLTKREYFAGMAIQGIMARETPPPFEMAANDSVDIADALISALNSEKI